MKISGGDILQHVDWKATLAGTAVDPPKRDGRLVLGDDDGEAVGRHNRLFSGSRVDWETGRPEAKGNIFWCGRNARKRKIFLC